MKYILLFFFLSLLHGQNRNDIVSKSIIGVPVHIKDKVYYNFYHYYRENDKSLIFAYEFNKGHFVFDHLSDSNMIAIIEYSLYLENESESFVEIWKDTLNKKSLNGSNYYLANRAIETDINNFKYIFKLKDKKTSKELVFKSEEVFRNKEMNLLFKKKNKLLANRGAIEQKDSVNVTLNGKRLNEANYKLRLKSDIDYILVNFNKLNTYNYRLTLLPNRIAEGKYKLSVESGEKVLLDRNIIVRNWTKPFSLRDINFAFQPFSLLLKEKESMKFESLNFTNKLRYFYSYWDKNLKSEQIDNPLMLEFYKRVDFAIHNYSNKLDRAWETDRGKTYIYYGRPEVITKKIKNNQELEIWVYKDFRKKFVKVNNIYKEMN